MDFNGKHFDLYRVSNDKHDIILHATDVEDALYCVSEQWPEIGGDAYVSQADESKYPDLELGRMRDLRK